MSTHDPRTTFDDMDTAAHAALPAHVILQQWRRLPPVLRGPRVTLREVRLTDATALMAMLSDDEVRRFVSPPPATMDGYMQFIERARELRSEGQGLCLGVIPEGSASPIGVFQLKQLEPIFGVAEWGFAFGSAYWGSGLFFDAAPLVVGFAFDVLGARRLEARVSVRNGRGNGAFRKLGAVQEALMRQSALHRGEALDEVLWVLMSDDWRALRPSLPRNVH